MKFVEWVDRVWKAFPVALHLASPWQQRHGLSAESKSLYQALGFAINVMPGDKLSWVRKAIGQALGELTEMGLLIPIGQEEVPRLLPSDYGEVLISQGSGPSHRPHPIDLPRREATFLRVVCQRSPMSDNDSGVVLLSLVDADTVYTQLGWPWEVERHSEALDLIEWLASRRLLKRALPYMCMPTYKAFCQVEGS
jgi:hypothetical protein